MGKKKESSCFQITPSVIFWDASLFRKGIPPNENDTKIVPRGIGIVHIRQRKNQKRY